MITRSYYLDKDRLLVCVINCDSHSGSIQFDFKSGELTANKPELMSPMLWLKFIRHFLAICRQMATPVIGDYD